MNKAFYILLFFSIPVMTVKSQKQLKDFIDKAYVAPNLDTIKQKASKRTCITLGINTPPKKPVLRKKSAEKINKEVNKKYPSKLKKKYQQEAEEKYKYIQEGDQITIPTRTRGNITGTFLGFSGKMLRVGGRNVLKQDVPKSVMDQLSESKSQANQNAYVSKKYTIPKAKYKSKIEKEINNKYFLKKEAFDKYHELLDQELVKLQGYQKNLLKEARLKALNAGLDKYLTEWGKNNPQAPLDKQVKLLADIRDLINSEYKSIGLNYYNTLPLVASLKVIHDKVPKDKLQVEFNRRLQVEESKKKKAFQQKILKIRKWECLTFSIKWTGRRVSTPKKDRIASFLNQTMTDKYELSQGNSYVLNKYGDKLYLKKYLIVTFKTNNTFSYKEKASSYTTSGKGKWSTFGKQITLKITPTSKSKRQQTIILAIDNFSSDKLWLGSNAYMYAAE